MKSSWLHSDDVNQCKDARLSQSRYHLHNHAADHKHSHGVIKMATISHGLDRMSSKSSLLRSRSTGNIGESSRPGSNKQLVSCVLDAQISFSLLGHRMISATCTRYFGDCESCHSTVHGRKHLYCRNCPVVLHKSEKCISHLTRECPLNKIGVNGWGESQHEVVRGLEDLLKLEDVFLAPVHEHQCPDCGTHLISNNFGHMEVKVHKMMNNTAQDEIPNAKLKRKKHFIKNLFGIAKSPGALKPNSSQSSTVNFFSNYESEDDLNYHVAEPSSEDSYANSPVSLHPNSAEKSTKKMLVRKFDCETRICHFSSRYFCKLCHWNDKWYIPGSVFLLNDIQKYPVSRSTYLALRVLWDVAMIDLPLEWINENQNARRVFLIRRRFHQLRVYSSSCPIALDIKCRYLADNEMGSHILNEPFSMRMCEVISTLDGTLESKLMQLYNTIISHIASCDDCSKRRSNCYVCNNEELMDYFGDNITNCSICSKPAHIECIGGDPQQAQTNFTGKCPNCIRKSAITSTVPLHSILLDKSSFGQAQHLHQGPLAFKLKTHGALT